MPKRRRRPSHLSSSHSSPSSGATTLRIIGGRLRGSLISYHGEARTRPMKERVREALFNLLGPRAKGRLAIDLFAGTGALALEALSRGAVAAVCLERHFPTARLIATNAEALQVADRIEIITGNTLTWWKMNAGRLPFSTDHPWLVFCSPPYALYHDSPAEIDQLIDGLWQAAPEQSLFAVEGDLAYDPARLPRGEWQVRDYPPARVCVGTTPASDQQIAAEADQDRTPPTPEGP